MRARLKGRIKKKRAEFDSKGNCRSCWKPIRKGMMIEILHLASPDGRDVFVTHAGGCMDKLLQWVSACQECEEENPHGDDQKITQCAKRKARGEV